MANPVMWDGSHLKTEPAPKNKRKQIKRSPIRSQSDIQKQKKKTWAFIRACMILAQRRTNGYLSCMSCGRIVESTRQLHLDHIVPTGNGGKWTPDNAQLLCGGFVGACHDDKHGQPKWSESA